MYSSCLSLTKRELLKFALKKHLLSLWIESYVGSSSEKGEVLILISLSSWLTEHQLQEKRRESAPLDQDCDKPLLSLSIYSSAGEDLLWLENDCDWILIKHSLNVTRKVKRKDKAQDPDGLKFFSGMFKSIFQSLLIQRGEI